MCVCVCVVYLCVCVWCVCEHQGIELATKYILGKEGSVVTLKFIRIDRESVC